MTETVFLSGSRAISRLNDVIRARLDNITRQGFRVIVGDANGADKALQSFFANMHYENVVVFCSGEVCRNNVGAWPIQKVAADPKLKGREFYMQKDKAMALAANFGFILWDGKSAGSITNVFELLRERRPAIVYFAPEKIFFNLKHAGDLLELLRHCDAADYREIDKKIHLNRRLLDLQPTIQASFDL